MNPNFTNPNNSGNGAPTNQNTQPQQQPFGAPGFGPVTPNNAQFSNPNSQSPFSAPNTTSPSGFGPPPTNMHSFPGPSINSSTQPNPTSSNGFGAPPTNASPFSAPPNPQSSNGFGAPPTNASPFSTQSNPQSSSGFGMPNPNPTSSNSNPTSYNSPSGFGPPRATSSPFSAPTGFGPPPVSNISHPPSYSSPSGFGPPPRTTSPFSAPTGFGPPPVSNSSSSNRPGPPSSKASPFSTPSGFGPPPAPSNTARFNPSYASGNAQGGSPNPGNSQNAYLPPSQPSFNTAPNPQPTMNRSGIAEGTPEWEAAVSSVIDMGFQRDKAVSALRQTNGNVEAAVEYLIDGTLPSSSSSSSSSNDMSRVRDMLTQNPSLVHNIIDQINIQPEAKNFLHQHPEEVFIQFEVDLSKIDFSQLAYNPQQNYQMGANQMPPSGNGQFPSYNPNPQTQQNNQLQNYLRESLSKLQPDQQEAVKNLANEFQNLNPIEIIQSYEACDYDIDTTRNLLRTL